MKWTLNTTLIRIIFIGNLGCIILLLSSNMAPYLNPSTWWPIALMGLFFPLLVIVTMLFFFFWLPIRPLRAVFSLLALFLSIPNIISTFGFSMPSIPVAKKDKEHLRVVTWNTGLMNYTALDSNTANRNNDIIFRKLREADADILCLQEFFTAVIPHHLNFIDSIARMLHYPYFYFSYDRSKFEGKFYSGSIIFSRYAIVDTQRVEYPSPFIGSVIKAGVIFSGDTIDIITTRLQSVHFQREDYMELGGFKSGKSSGFGGAKRIINKLRFGYNSRIVQVQLVTDMISKSRRPLVFTGDLNDVPVSYTYTQVKKGLEDVWINKGSGFGRTFIYLSPTLRIDHIFYNGRFKGRHVQRILAEGASDHNALLADLIFNQNAE